MLPASCRADLQEPCRGISGDLFGDSSQAVAPPHVTIGAESGWHAACSVGPRTMVGSEVKGREQALRNGQLVSAYRIEEVVGTGGMGWVYRAHHALTG